MKKITLGHKCEEKLNMGRAKGCQNKRYYHWKFILKDPSNVTKVIWSKNYKVMQDMFDDLKGTFSQHQLTSYAGKLRKCPKLMEIKKIHIDITR